DQLVNLAKLGGRGEKDDAEVSVVRRGGEARSIDAQNSGGAKKSQDEVFIRLASRQGNSRHRIKRGRWLDTGDAFDGIHTLGGDARAFAQRIAKRLLMRAIAGECRRECVL